jgi:hypothetical protein
MVDIFLFEIECSEELGNYRLADDLLGKMIKMASSKTKEIKKNVKKNFNIDDIHFSQSSKKFTVICKSGITKSMKDKIRKEVEPYSVSFIYQ